MVLTSNLLLIANPLVFRVAVIAVDPNSPREGGIIETFFYRFLGETVHKVWPWFFILLTIALISSIFKYWMRMTFITVSRDAEMEMRSKLFDKIQMQSMAFFDRYKIGELLSRLTNDIAAYRDVLGPGIMYPIIFLTIIIPGFMALFAISKPLAMISIIPLLALPLVNYLIRGHIYQVAMQVQKALGKMSSMVQEHFSAIRIVKSYTIEKETKKQFQELSKNMLEKELKLSYYQGSLFPFFNFLTKMITGILVLASGWIILKEWEELSAADFVSFMWIQSYIFFPVLSLSWLIPVYERGKAAYNRLLEIYVKPIEVRDTPHSKLHISPKANITIKDLTFKYPTGDAPVLWDINLEIYGGSFVGITGPVGAGKTTLFKLLSREYEISKGMIYIAGREIHEYSLKAFHAQIVTVEQVPFLFSKSIAENVKFGRRKASQEELINVSRFADLHETILEFPEQYETIIGERGMTLSGGQKQRLAMARAFLVNRSILLLDDVFSAVDIGTEKRIFNAMQHNFIDKTVLLITHRVSVLEKMDRIIYMENGKILEDGTHLELMQKEGHYAALVQLQKLKDESP
jgi:ATP-binding cassette subfamily B protein